MGNCCDKPLGRHWADCDCPHCEDARKKQKDLLEKLRQKMEQGLDYYDNERAKAVLEEANENRNSRKPTS